MQRKFVVVERDRFWRYNFYDRAGWRMLGQKGVKRRQKLEKEEKMSKLPAPSETDFAQLTHTAKRNRYQ